MRLFFIFAKNKHFFIVIIIINVNIFLFILNWPTLVCYYVITQLNSSNILVRNIITMTILTENIITAHALRRNKHENTSLLKTKLPNHWRELLVRILMKSLFKKS